MTNLPKSLRERMAEQSAAFEGRGYGAFRDIQRHRIRINKTRPLCGLSNLATEQLDLFSALKVPRPTSRDCPKA